MKARIKGTNTAVECIEADYLNHVGFGIKCKHSNGCYDIISGNCLIELENDFDWQSFRNQAAKDILCAMIGEVIKQRNGSDLIDETVDSAIVIANKLISKLKEKEKL